jgi:glycosyltransferase involved in cell wall biosynthesis
MTEPRPLRILLAGSWDDDSNRLLKIFHAYRSAGYDVRFVGMDRMSRKPKRGTVDGLPFEYLTRGWGYSNPKLLLGYPVWFLKYLFYLLRADTDLVHAFEFDTGVPTAIVCALRGIPYLYDVQDNFDLRKHWWFPLKQIIRGLDRWVVRRAAGVIMPDKNRIVGPFAGAEEKIAIIPNCPPDVPPPAGLPARDNRLTVLAMGELSSRRGIDLLLAAAADLPNIHLLMAGRFTDSAVEKRALAMPQVSFRGWLSWEQAIALGYQADIVFAFYNPEFAVNLLANAQKWFDAMMTGTPILSNSEIKNAAWLIEQDIAYLCPYGDVEKLRETLMSIVADPATAKRKGRNARSLFEQQFNWTLMQKRLLSLAAGALQQRTLAAKAVNGNSRV